MTRITIFLLLAASVLVALGLSASRQAAPRVEAVTDRRPAPEKARSRTPTPSTREMPANYRALLTRSIFARDGRASDKVVGGGPGGPGRPTSQGSWVGPPGTEIKLAFRGVTLSNGSYTAFIEDMTGGGIRRFSRGDAIAAGRIADITLDGLDYEFGKNVKRVVLGQNLAGAVVPPPAPPATAPAPPPAEGNGPHGPGRGRPPGGGPPGPPGPGGPAEAPSPAPGQ